MTTSFISEEAHNNIVENRYVIESRANYDWLMESKKQLQNGECGRHELIETSEKTKG